MGKHQHHNCCEHEKMAYCKVCRVVYCASCGKEWRDNYTYTYPYGTGTWITPTISAGTNVESNGTTGTTVYDHNH